MSVFLRLLGALILLGVVSFAGLIWLFQPASYEQAHRSWMGPNDRLVSLNGENWRVRETGPQDGPVMVMIHGFSHSLESMDALAQYFDDRYRVIRFDLPAHGLTGPRQDRAYNPSALSREVSALISQITDQHVTLLGQSLGGFIAWKIASKTPHQIDNLILIAPEGFPNSSVRDDDAAIPLQMRIYLSQAPLSTVQAMTEALYSNPDRVTPAQTERIQSLIRVAGNGKAKIELLEQLTIPDPNPQLRAIKAPTLIIWGQNDRVISPIQGPRFAAAIDNSQLVLIKDAGHLPHEEKPQDTAGVIQAFLENSAP